MTKEQFREFVTRVVIGDTPVTAIKKIVDQWESDVNDARIAGQDEATSAIESYSQPIYMEGDTSAQPCMGPCCGGSI